MKNKNEILGVLLSESRTNILYIFGEYNILKIRNKYIPGVEASPPWSFNKIPERRPSAILATSNKIPNSHTNLQETDTTGLETNNEATMNI